MPLDRAAGGVHARDRATSIAATSTRGTSRSNGGCRTICRWTSPTSAPRGTGGYAALDINAPQTLGGGDSEPSLRVAWDASSAIDSWGQRLKTNYNSLQIALNKPFTHGFLFKGAYTLGKAMNDERRRRPRPP